MTTAVALCNRVSRDIRGRPHQPWAGDRTFRSSAPHREAPTGPTPCKDRIRIVGGSLPVDRPPHVWGLDLAFEDPRGPGWD
jgi:hypothetical protein